MISRDEASEIVESLGDFPAVGILGPRQSGKTTLAREVAGTRPSLYLDMERPQDRRILDDPEPFLAAHATELVIIDEIQRKPDLFPVLRGLIDEQRREGKRAGRFLLLGSASGALLKQSSESLAGRIIYHELPPLLVSEAEQEDVDRIWLRGGFPESLLAPSERASGAWRRSFVTQQIEREIPLLGIRTPSSTIRRLATMLATAQARPFNASELAANLGLNPHTITAHADIFCGMMLGRRLNPWFVNVHKRLMKAPRFYWRDSGILHSMLGIGTLRELLSHIALGASWEGFVIEQLIASAGGAAEPWYYRTSAGAEIDLLLETAAGRMWAIEIKRSAAPVPSKGFHIACRDTEAERRMVVYSGSRMYQDSSGVEYWPVRDAAREIRRLRKGRSGAAA